MKRLAQIISPAVFLAAGNYFAGAENAVTNLDGLRLLEPGPEKIYRDVRIEAEVCSISPSRRELVLADASGALVLRVDAAAQARAGDKILLSGSHCSVRTESWGVTLGTAPLVDNDELHGPTEKNGKVFLEPGRVPLRVEWFNASRGSALNLAWHLPGGVREKIPAALLWRRDESGVWTNGLTWQCYEGTWKALPNFADLPVVAAGTVPDFTLAVAARRDFVGLVFDGFLDVPRSSVYDFYLRSDDGAQFFIGESAVKISVLGSGPPPAPLALKPGAAGAESRWAESAGTVQQVFVRDDGLEILLSSSDGPLRVRLVGRTAPPVLPLEARVTARGVAQPAFRPDGASGFGILEVASPDDLLFEPARSGSETDWLTTAAQVARLSRAEAAQAQRVKLRGVVTCDAPEIYFGSVIQDQTRGVYCFWSETNSVTGRPQRRPRFGEFWEIEGLSKPGIFAPDIQVTSMRCLGEGELPPSVSPARGQLLNGSLDNQFIEMQGIVTDADTNGVVFLMYGGKIRVQLTPPLGKELQMKRNKIVRLRGCLLAVWNEETHEVNLGEIRLGNASVMSETQVSADPFDAPIKDVDDLRRFDVAAGLFQRVKISGQIVGKRGEEFFMLNGSRGLRFVPRDVVTVSAGDLVEVSGLPELDGPSPVLREAVVRRTGFAPLPEPLPLNDDELFRPQNDALRVRLSAVLTGLRAASGATIFDLQAGGNYFSARLRAPAEALPEFEPGSRVELTGVYVSLSASQWISGRQLGSFEILLSSPNDVRVIARPPWWTLRRLLAVTGVLSAVLVLAALWITQLRRRVEQRTAQLRHEITERERAEQLRVVEVERSRIARDLHDDLGVGLTEIGLLGDLAGVAKVGTTAHNGLAGEISARARGLVSALDEIVWAINPANDNSLSLGDYFSRYAESLLQRAGLPCHIDVTAVSRDIKITSELRHHLFLAFKEALNNVIKHARAREVRIHIAMELGRLVISVSDDGQGIVNPAGDGSPDGMRGMRERLAQIGGVCEIQSVPDQGTKVIFSLAVETNSLRHD